MKPKNKKLRSRPYRSRSMRYRDRFEVVSQFSAYNETSIFMAWLSKKSAEKLADRLNKAVDECADYLENHKDEIRKIRY